MSTDFTKPGWVAAVVLAAGLLASPALRAESDKAGTARTVTRKVAPLYPEIARQWRLTGTVRMTASVAPDGAVTSVKALGGNPLFVLAAERAILQWKYERSAKATTETVAITFRDTQ